MANNPTSANHNQRYVFIDALRGVAALGVLFFHLVHSTVMALTLERILPSSLALINTYGALGVQIFFVLSGFVIAHSLRNNPLTQRSIGNFILRRQLRLDPPYWFMIVVVLCLQRISLAIPSLVTEPMPRFTDVLLNFLYLHEIAGAKGIVVVAWTLCIEIQFYLVFIALLALGNKLAQVATAQNTKVFAGLVFVTGLASLVVVHSTFHPAWFIQYWFYFAAGVLCYWSIRKIISHWVFLSFLVLFGLSLSVSFLNDHVTDLNHVTERSSSGPGMMVGLLTAVAIYVVGCKGRLTNLWNHSLLQYFGRISYSLYLVHLPVLIIILSGAYKITGENEKMAVVWSILAGLISIGAAHLLYIVIERPSMRFASKIKQRNLSQDGNKSQHTIEEADGGPVTGTDNASILPQAEI